MRVVCNTNLDLTGEEWPSEMPCCPRVGDLIQSNTMWGRFQLELEVVSVTWKKSNRAYHMVLDYSDQSWVPHIVLHTTSWHKKLVCRRSEQGCTCSPGSITAFYEWYAPLVGKSVGSFI